MDYASDLESMRREQERKLEEAWRTFVEQFPTESECVEFLCSFISASNSTCNNCGSSELERKFGEREGRCKRCRRTNHPTAQTFFRRVRKIRPWLARIYFFEQGVCVSSSKFAKMLEIASSTAQIIFKKLTSVLLRLLVENGINVLSKALLDIVARRSLKTPADEHPIEEESVLAEQVRRNEETRQAHGAAETSSAKNETIEKNARDDGLETTEIQIYKLISDEPITLDELCALATIPGWTVASTLTMLELKGLISSLPGERLSK